MILKVKLVERPIICLGGELTKCGTGESSCGVWAFSPTAAHSQWGSHLQCNGDDPRKDSTMTRSAAASLALLLVPFFLLATFSRASASWQIFCPKTVFYQPRPPCIKYKSVCPKPICPCCPPERFAYYYPTCWHPWLGPANYSHCPCPMPPPVALVPPIQGNAPATGQEQLPAPAPMPSQPNPPKVLKSARLSIIPPRPAVAESEPEF